MIENELTYSKKHERKNSTKKIVGGAALSAAVTLATPGVLFAENSSEQDVDPSFNTSPISIEDRSVCSIPSNKTIFENDSISVIIPEEVESMGKSKVPPDYYRKEFDSEKAVPYEESTSIDINKQKTTQKAEKKEEVNKKKIYKKNLFRKKGYVRQPDNRTCVAASTQMMLNFDEDIKEADWRLNTSSKKTYEIFSFARGHDTLDPTGVGSDANGWEKALERYGDGEWEIRAYKRRLRAIKDSVMAIARTGKPVGMVGWAGKHAQVITGYIVEGGDPEETRHFKVKAVFLSDPLAGNGMVNKKISYEELTGGRFVDTLSSYKEKDSHGKNGEPIWKKWYNKYTLIIPTE